MNYSPDQNRLGGFSENDGTIDFYLRIKSLLSKNSIVLDLGAGSGSWINDTCDLRRNIRLIKGNVSKIYGTDIDQDIFENKTIDEAKIMSANQVPVADSFFDLIICDFVLEHVENPKKFVNEINRLLKPGGWFCARTPHKYSYQAFFARLFPNKHHQGLLKYIKPDTQDRAFPTKYKLNTLRKISQYFPGYKSKSFIFRANPAYYFGNIFIYKIQKLISSVFFRWFSGCIFVYLKKPYVE